MGKIFFVPTSKLIFSSLYPEKRGIDPSKNYEKIVYNRLMKFYKLDLESSHRLFENDARLIQKRGDNLESYYFERNKGLDEHLDALLSSFNNFPRLLSYVDNMNEFTFSELVKFRFILLIMIDAYLKSMDTLEIAQFEKKAIRKSELDAYEELKTSIIELKLSMRTQEQYSYFWEYLSKVISSRLGYLMGVINNKLRTELNFLFETFCLAEPKKTLLESDMATYKKANFDRVKHDQKILSRYDVNSFIKE